MKKIMRFLVRKVPRPYLIKFSFLFSKIVAFFYRGDNVYCPVCESSFRKFLPYGNKGADNRLCPRCLSLERHRLLWLYLKNKTPFFSHKLKLLHIAPEQPFLKRFRALKNIDYTTADLESPIADVKLDVREMPLKSDSFDVVFCNHVLEHIDREQAAMKEILRVLRPGGWAILQVPIDPERTQTFEDASITDPKEREKVFGQYDHVRVYGSDYPKHLEKAGFEVIPERYVDEFSREQVQRMRLDMNETIYFCQKPEK